MLSSHGYNSPKAQSPSQPSSNIATSNAHQNAELFITTLFQHRDKDRFQLHGLAIKTASTPSQTICFLSLKNPNPLH
jgi:hypothetical protein